MVTTQLCGLIILSIILYIIFTHKDLGTFSDKLFHVFLYADTVLLLLDISSVFAIMYIPNQMIRNIICKLYLLSLLVDAFMLFLYIHSDTKGLKHYHRFVWINGIVAGLCGVGILFLPINCYYDGNSLYTYGDSTTLTYIVTGYVIFSSLVSLFVNKKDFSSRKLRSIVLWIAIWIIAAVIQLIYPYVLVVGFASTVGCTLLFFELENPESNRDKDTGLFNRFSFSRYMEHIRLQSEEYDLIMISIPSRYSSGDDTNSLEERLVQKLLTQDTGLAFRYADNDFLFIYESKKMNALEEITRAQAQYKETDVLSYAFTLISRIKHMDVSFLLQEIHDEEKPEGDVRYISQKDYDDLIAFYKIKQMIINAIRNDRILIYMQPIYSIKDGRFVSAEVLVRLLDEDNNLIQPGVFIPVAEKTGLITKIGDIVFEKTCKFIHQNDMSELGLKYLEINLSVKNGENPNLWWKYQDIMQEYKVDPSMINLEITETDSLRQKAQLLDNMSHLMSLGVRFSLDDFGSGQSNMDYLRDMPVSIVKFDKEMTQKFFTDDVSRIILKGTLSIIKNLNKKTVSEGVETEDHFMRMKELGIDYIQGYYFSRPLPCQDFVTFLRENNYLSEEMDRNE